MKATDDMLALARVAELICFDMTMQREFVMNRLDGRTEAATKEAFFGFTCREVERLHYRQYRSGWCVFFRLYDGRVIDSAGVAQEHTDPLLYDKLIH
jgi:hypothetical protein